MKIEILKTIEEFTGFSEIKIGVYRVKISDTDNNNGLRTFVRNDSFVGAIEHLLSGSVISRVTSKAKEEFMIAITESERRNKED